MYQIFAVILGQSLQTEPESSGKLLHILNSTWSFLTFPGVFFTSKNVISFLLKMTTYTIYFGIWIKFWNPLQGDGGGGLKVMSFCACLRSCCCLLDQNKMATQSDFDQNR